MIQTRYKLLNYCFCGFFVCFLFVFMEREHEIVSLMKFLVVMNLFFMLYSVCLFQLIILVYFFSFFFGP